MAHMQPYLIIFPQKVAFKIINFHSRNTAGQRLKPHHFKHFCSLSLYIFFPSVFSSLTLLSISSAFVFLSLQWRDQSQRASEEEDGDRWRTKSLSGRSVRSGARYPCLQRRSLLLQRWSSRLWPLIWTCGWDPPTCPLQCKSVRSDTLDPSSMPTPITCLLPRT